MPSSGSIWERQKPKQAFLVHSFRLNKNKKMTRARQLTPREVEKARWLRGRGVSWAEIARRFNNAPRESVRRQLDNTYRLARNAAARRYWNEIKGSTERVQRDPSLKPDFSRAPEYVIAERDRAYNFTPTLNHVLLGDPPPSRSALARFSGNAEFLGLIRRKRIERKRL